MKTKYFMTKKEYGRQLLEKFWDGNRQEYTDINVMEKRVDMHNRLLFFVRKYSEKDYKTENEMIDMAKELLSEDAKWTKNYWKKQQEKTENNN